MKKESYNLFLIQRRALFYALLINFIFLLVEFAGGILTNSLALMADAGHMFMDVVALSIAFLAINVSRKKPTLHQTYGFQRAEIIAAFVNGILLLIAVFFIWIEAIKRIINPPSLKTLEMLIIALTGFFANLISSAIVFKHSDKNLNLKAAFLHLFWDTFSSVGVITGALVIRFTGWLIIDPVISLFLGVFIIMGCLKILKESFHILMLSTPREVDIVEVKRGIEKINGVVNVHDIHSWILSWGRNALSAHILVCPEVNADEKLKEIVNYIITNFPVEHVTIQIEKENVQPVICTECGAPL